VPWGYQYFKKIFCATRIFSSAEGGDGAGGRARFSLEALDKLRASVSGHGEESFGFISI
jgi:hypothetical protein